MTGKLKLSFILFFIIILFPTLIFSLYEITSFSQYEKMIQDTYKRQIGTMLLTINQKTEAIINDWVNNLNTEFKNNQDIESWLKEFMSNTPSVENVFKTDGEEIIFSNIPLFKEDRNTIEKLLIEKKQVIDQLKVYIKDNYRKPESFQIKEKNKILTIFICDSVSEKISVCGMVFNPNVFIDEVLGPKIQETAREGFNIFVFEGEEKNLVYSSDRRETPEDIIAEGDFWLLPGYSSGISVKSTTISEITKPRTRNLLILIISVNLALLFGVFLLFRNMKSEMELTLLKSDFVSNVSHEIRTPLALIQMYIETLQMDRVKTEEKKKDYYNIVLQETIRLSGIVNKILNFTQMEKGKRKYQFSDTNVNEIVEKIIHTYRFHFENKGFEYTVELDDDISLIFADKEAINDCVINLIDNAIKYSDEKKMIVLRTGKMGDKIFIEVKDFGIGISEKDQKYIFDKFFRVTSGDLAHKAKGTGLGLTIVKHVMDAHKGEIVVQSKKGSGSSFKLVFCPEGVMA